MVRVPKMLCAAALIAAFPFSGLAQRPPAPAAAPLPPPPYAVYADLVLASPVIVDAAIRGMTRIKGAEAADVATNHARFYIEADVQALIRGPRPLLPRIGYVLDVMLDSRGKAPKLKKLRVLLFGRPVADNPGQIQLSRIDSQRPWTPAADELTRRIITETLATGAPPEITGVGNAFHVPGSLPGEGETQVFLTTAGGQPVSLSILRRPGQQRRWSVSLKDIVDEGSGPPRRDTLLWYRLACALPPALPSNDPSPESLIAAEDYRFVIDALGPCGRDPAF